MRVIAYCLLCKRTLRTCRSFTGAFREIDDHLQWRHGIAWLSPTGIDIHEYADAYVRYFRKSELDDYEKHIVSSIRLEIAKHRFYGYFLDGKPAAVITDVFAIYLESAKEAVLERLKGRKGKWIYPQKFKMYRKYAKLVREHYQQQRGRELHHKYAELKRERAELLKAFVERGLGTEEDFHKLLKKLKEEEERERRARIKEEREREWKALTPQEKLGLYPEALCGQRPTVIRKKLFGV